jgi:hypothetical protein
VGRGQALALSSFAGALFAQDDEIQTCWHCYFFKKPS